MNLNSPERLAIDPNDMPSQVGLVAKVGNGSFEMDNGWSLGLPEEACEWVKPDMVYELWGKGIGYNVRGLAIDGKVIRYLTEAEDKAERERQCAENARKKEEQFEATREKYFADIVVLPDVLKARFAKFQAHNPRFDIEYGGYELFCCQEAVVMANRAAEREEIDRAEVDEFWKDRFAMQYPGLALDDLPADPKVRWLYWAVAINGKPYNYDYARQMEVMGTSDGHSGNTFGMAVILAKCLLTDPEYATKMHGALTPLVGCEAYGCPHPAEETEVTA